MASKSLRVHRYTTRDVAPADRYEIWLNHWPGMAPLYHTDPLEQFRVTTSIAQFDGISLVQTDIAAQRWKRDRRLVDHGNDALSLTLNLDGKAWGVAGTQDWVQMPGSVVVVDRAQTSSHVSAGGRSVSITIPRALALEAGIDVASLHGLVLTPDEHAIFTGHAMQLLNLLPHFTEADTGLLARSLIDTIALSLKTAHHIQAPIRDEDPATLQMRADREIRANLGSSALTITNLCRRLGVSRSTLHRVFEPSGGVQAHIRDLRLDAARHALTHPGRPERIGELAERLGFSDTAHLSRLFKARFGETPGDCRERAAKSLK